MTVNLFQILGYSLSVEKLQLHNQQFLRSIIVLGLAICPRFRHHLHVEAFIVVVGVVIQKLCVPFCACITPRWGHNVT